MSCEQDIYELEERLRTAQLKGDIEALSALLDDTLSFSILNGTVIDKMDDLSSHRSPDFRITKMHMIDRRTQCYEHAAVINVLMDVSAIMGGAIQHHTIRYTRIWYRFSDGWRVISGSMCTG